MRTNRVSYWKTVFAGWALSTIALGLADLLAFWPAAAGLGLLRWLACGALTVIGLAASFVAIGGGFALHADAQEAIGFRGAGAADHRPH